MKLIIQNLLEKGIEERRIFYWTCDLTSAPKDIVDLVNSYLNFSRQYYPEHRLYIFLDEISSVQDWQQGIKYLFDIGKLKNCSLIVTGSHIIDLRKASERLPGRRGEVEDILDKVLLPMKFSEYSETRDSEIKQVIERLNLRSLDNRIRLLQNLSEGSIPNEMIELSLYSNKLEVLLNDYLITGGIAKAVDCYIEDGSIPNRVYETYIDVIIGDMVRWRRQERYLKQILKRIIETITTQISWRSLKKNTDIASHPTIQDYANILEESFIITYLYRLNLNTGLPFLEKNKKIHFTDPFIFHVINSWISGQNGYETTLDFLREKENKSKLIECLICNHLIRLMFNIRRSQLFDYANEVFFYQGKGGKNKEVDFIVKLDSKYLPIEVKYQPNIVRSDLWGLLNFRNITQSYSGIVITESSLKEETYVEVPAHLFLLLI